MMGYNVYVLTNGRWRRANEKPFKSRVDAASWSRRTVPHPLKYGRVKIM